MRQEWHESACWSDWVDEDWADEWEWHESAYWSDWGDEDWADDCVDSAEAWEGTTESQGATEHLREHTGIYGDTAKGWRLRWLPAPPLKFQLSAPGAL